MKSLNTAAKYGDRDAVAAILNAGDYDFNLEDIVRSSDTALHHAARRGDMYMFSMLLNHGAKLENKNESGQTPLYEAATAGHLGIISILKSRYEKDKNGKSGDVMRAALDATSSGSNAFGTAIYYRQTTAALAIFEEIKDEKFHQEKWHPNHKRMKFEYLVRALRTHNSTVFRALKTFYSDGESEGSEYLEILKYCSDEGKDNLLHLGARYGSYTNLLMLMRDIPDLSETDQYKLVNGQNSERQHCRTPMHEACAVGSLKVAGLIASLSSFDDSVTTTVGRTPLDIAFRYMHMGDGIPASDGDPAKVHELLKSKYLEKYFPDKESNSADYKEAEIFRKRKEIIERNKKGEKINVSGLDERLFTDPKLDNMQIHSDSTSADHLISSIKLNNATQMDVIYLKRARYASRASDEMLFDSCVSKIKDLTTADQFGLTALHYATRLNSPRLINRILDRSVSDAENKRISVDIGAYNSSHGITSLYEACYFGQYDAYVELCERGADIFFNSAEKEGWTPLILAAWSGCADIILDILQRAHKAYSSQRDRPKLVEYVNKKNKNGESALSLVVSCICNPRKDLRLADNEKLIQAVAELLEADADPNWLAGTKNPKAPMHWAAISGRCDIGTMLLKAGASPNSAMETTKFTPLHYAAFMGQVDFLRLLLAWNADAFAKTYDGKIPIMLSSGAHSQTIRRVLARSMYNQSCGGYTFFGRDTNYDQIVTKTNGATSYDISELHSMNPP